jgi:hypothetical protein
MRPKKTVSVYVPVSVSSNGQQVEPRSTDVLLGRGNGVSIWKGNINFRTIVWEYRDEYLHAVRYEKGKIAEKVFDRISSLSPPGRFLEMLVDDHFFVVGRNRSIEKICQALREKKLRFAPANVPSWSLPTKTTSYSRMQQYQGSQLLAIAPKPTSTSTSTPTPVSSGVSANAVYVSPVTTPVLPVVSAAVAQSSAVQVGVSTLTTPPRAVTPEQKTQPPRCKLNEESLSRTKRSLFAITPSPSPSTSTSTSTSTSNRNAKKKKLLQDIVITCQDSHVHTVHTSKPGTTMTSSTTTTSSINVVDKVQIQQGVKSISNIITRPQLALIQPTLHSIAAGVSTAADNSFVIGFPPRDSTADSSPVPVAAAVSILDSTNVNGISAIPRPHPFNSMDCNSRIGDDTVRRVSFSPSEDQWSSSNNASDDRSLKGYYYDVFEEPAGRMVTTTTVTTTASQMHPMRGWVPSTGLGNTTTTVASSTSVPMPVPMSCTMDAHSRYERRHNNAIEALWDFEDAIDMHLDEISILSASEMENGAHYIKSSIDILDEAFALISSVTESPKTVLESNNNIWCTASAVNSPRTFPSLDDIADFVINDDEQLKVQADDYNYIFSDEDYIAIISDEHFDTIQYGSV